MTLINGVVYGLEVLRQYGDRKRLETLFFDTIDNRYDFITQFVKRDDSISRVFDTHLHGLTNDVEIITNVSIKGLDSISKIDYYQIHKKAFERWKEIFRDNGDSVTSLWN